MKYLFVIFAALFLASPVCAQPGTVKKRARNDAPPVRIEPSPALQMLLGTAVGETLKSLLPKTVKPENVAATLIDVRDPQNLKSASVRGAAPIYPASVVKLFYLAALHRQLEDGKIKPTPELERGLRDMIVASSNDATHYILDVLTGAPNGAELSPPELAAFARKRGAVNRYFAALGYRGVNVSQKTYCEDIYGRERQFWNDGKNRNMLTTDATARLLAEIALGRFVTPARSRQMMDLLKRDFGGEAKDPHDQAHGFTAIALKKLKMTDAKIWSKAGWTSKSRHDAAYVETPDGLKFVLVIFTENNADEPGIIAGIAERVIENFIK